MSQMILHGLHTAFAFIAVLAVIVFIHEFGHYLVARLCGVRIVAFSIGFGRELFGITDRTGTRWKVSLLPLGGYVKMFGDEGAASTPDKVGIDQMTAEERKVSFHFQPLYKKAMIVVAGPLFNFILTIGIFTYFIFTNGLETTEPLVGEVMPNSPAAVAGFQKSDRILSIDGKPVVHFGDIPNMIATNVGTRIHVEYQRGVEKRTADLTPEMKEDKDPLGNTSRHPMIGIRSLKMTYGDVGLPRALWESAKKTEQITAMTFEYIGQLIHGQRGPEELHGVIDIAKLSGQAAEQGFLTVLWFVALLSANLGMVNLFPIPPLDGGHLIYYVVEGFRGRPMAERYQELGYRAGFALILMLMAFTIYNDIRQF